MHLADIVGIGRTCCGEQWNRSLVDLAVAGGAEALDEAGAKPTAIIAGNALSGALGDQRNLAAYVAERLGLHGCETHTVEADEASGGAALRLGLALVEAGMHETVLVLGAEKITDALPDELEAVRAGGLDVMREAGFGFGPNIAAALTMQRYLETHRVDRALFYHPSAVAHAHAADNDRAFFAWALTEEQYLHSPIVADPLTVCDCAPHCDGAAAVVLRKPSSGRSAIRVTGSSAISWRPTIAGPAIDLELPAAIRSAAAALEQAGVVLDDISLFELHDSSTVMAALSLEAVGIADRGRGLQVAASGALSRDGSRPTWTFGGHKARGHAAGACGLFQVAEAVLQLRDEAGACQVNGAGRALVQCLGSFGSTAITHVLSR